MIRRVQLIVLVFCCFAAREVSAQCLGGKTISGTNSGLTGSDCSQRRTIITAVPFLLISPDSRSSGMGDVGVATSPDDASAHWNPGKLAFIKTNLGFSGSYTPWLAKITNDMSISYLSFHKRLTKTQVIGANIRYFNLGNIVLTDENAQQFGEFVPREFEIGVTYSQALTKNFSIGGNFKFIYSNLVGSVGNTSSDSRPGTAAAVDFGVYNARPFVLGGKDAKYSWGVNISNLGNKITYSNSTALDFIPSNLRLGNTLKLKLDPFNSLSFSFDLNKLLVPTPPVYERDENGVIVRDANGDPKIFAGKDPNRGFISGVFGSLNDAPDGFSEELQEFSLAFGIEYWYNDVFAFRAGYFGENANKGNRKYLSVGAGLRYQKFGLDVAYLVPKERNHPLAETIRFSLLVSFDKEDDGAIKDEN